MAETRRQGIALATGICFLIGTLLVIQVWLVAAALDALKSNDTGVLVAAALVSLVLFAANAGLLAYLWSFDARLEPPRG